MKLGRVGTLVAAGLVGASLLLSPLAYAEEGTQGSSMSDSQKAPTKTHKAKKHKSGAKKKTTTTAPEKPE
jgi:hypothetical protein